MTSEVIDQAKEKMFCITNKKKLKFLFNCSEIRLSTFNWVLLD